MSDAGLHRRWLILGGVIVAMIVGAQFLPEAAPAEKRPRDYISFCATGFVAAKRLVPALRGGSPGYTDPAILTQGPPVRIQCAYTAPNEDIGAITLELRCERPMDRACYDVLVVFAPGGRPVYVAP